MCGFAEILRPYDNRVFTTASVLQAWKIFFVARLSMENVVFYAKLTITEMVYKPIFDYDIELMQKI